jgi:ComF family protein
VLRAGALALADALLSVLLAPVCVACGLPLERPTGGPVCRSCLHAIAPLVPPLCDACGDPLPAWLDPCGPTAICLHCRASPRTVERARAAGEYDGVLRSLVHGLKYDGRRSLARPLGALMRVRGGEVLAGADAVVPVPLHRSRRRARGFNQADDLARRLGLPVVAALRRMRATATQAELAADRRSVNVSGAFGTTRAAAELRGKIVVVVDDVRTTGATIEACACALKESGVREVRALTAARVAGARR